MNEQAFLAAVYDVLSTQTGIDRTDIQPVSNLVEDLHIDSLDVIELEIEFEERLGIDDIEEAGFETWYYRQSGKTLLTDATVEDVIQFLRTLVTLDDEQ